MRNPLRPKVGLSPELSARVDDVGADIRATLDEVQEAAIAAKVAFSCIAVAALALVLIAAIQGSKNGQ